MTAAAAAALSAWQIDGAMRPAPAGGLINITWLVGNPPRAVLQRVNEIFDPKIHLDIAAVTERLGAAGLVTPRLLPTRDGALYHLDDSGCWRMLSFVAGRTVDRVTSPARAAAAGDLVGRFHRALDGWTYRFQAPRRDIHDTPRRMSELGVALEEVAEHPLIEPARHVGGEILADWARWDGELELPERPCHGDLKISNLRFAAASPARVEEAVCLVDLDTVGPMSLASEMGDAWRSWCNPAAEDEPGASHLDVELFAASAGAWLQAGPRLSSAERAALVPAIERIALELAARFCTDALRNTYFAEDRARYPGLGEHNLLRARGQLALARSALTRRAACEAALRGLR